MIGKIEDYDFLSQLKILLSYIELCANMNAECTDKKTFEKQKVLVHRETEKCLSRIGIQCRMGLPLPSLSPFCRMGAELLFYTSEALLNVRTLERIYGLEHEPLFERHTATALEICQSAKKALFFGDVPSKSDSPLTLLLDRCVAGLKHCQEHADDELSDFPLVKALMIKDVNEEYMRFFSLFLRFTQCSLLFPL